MVKLNEDAFAAVNAAFPDLAKQERAANSSSKATTTSSSAKKRKGVGASTVESSSDKVGEADIHKRILQIGSKKRKKLADDEEAFEEGVGASRPVSGTEFDKKRNLDLYDDSADEEEDVGRTAIDRISNTKVDLPNVEYILPKPGKNKKKKVGKRERQTQKEAEGASTEPNAAEPNGTPQKNEVLCGLGDGDKDGRSDANVDGEALEDTKKRKRRKVRSRQKNIRKDKRATKPAHLIPGSSDYRGLPLTPETRRKLSMPESRRQIKLKSYWSGQEKNAGGERTSA